MSRQQTRNGKTARAELTQARHPCRAEASQFRPGTHALDGKHSVDAAFGRFGQEGILTRKVASYACARSEHHMGKEDEMRVLVPTFPPPVIVSPPSR